MEVGAVKQAYNNEVIHLKKKLNQAKTQIIHKLTRKAKTLKESKGPNNVKDKLNRKADSAVKEVLLIKKVQAKHLARFAITYKGELKDCLNRSTVDNEKVYARLLLHKILQDKYKFLRDRFLNIPINDLFMSRQERLKLKKEAKENKNKKKGNKGTQITKENMNDSISTTDEWTVEDIDMTNSNENELNRDDDSLNENDSTESFVDQNSADKDSASEVSMNEDECSINQNSADENSTSEICVNEDDNNANCEFESDAEVNIPRKDESDESGVSEKELNKTPINHNEIDKPLKVKEFATVKLKKKAAKKSKTAFNEKKDLTEKLRRKRDKINIEPVQKNKMVDPFFITSTGENYMSLVELRPPDEIKEVHKQGNRKLRRAAMFGHVPKLRKKDFKKQNNNKFQTKHDIGIQKSNVFKQDRNVKNFNNIKLDFKQKSSRDKVPEKLHPSWEAKKKMSGILPFQGKKIVFE